MSREDSHNLGHLIRRATQGDSKVSEVTGELKKFRVVTGGLVHADTRQGPSTWKELRPEEAGTQEEVEGNSRNARGDRWKEQVQRGVQPTGQGSG